MSKTLVKVTPEWCENKTCENPEFEQCCETDEYQLCSRDKRWMVTRVAQNGNLSREESERICRRYGIREDWLK